MLDYFVMTSAKRITLILLLVILVVGNSHAGVFAADIAAEGTPVRKLQRGFVNVALSPMEISHELAKGKNEESFVPTWFTGFGRGSIYMVGRALAGVYDMITAPVALPAGYEPLVQPEFPWQLLEDNPNP